MSTDVNQCIELLKGQITEQGKKLDGLIIDMAALKANYDFAKLIIQWALFPLIVILGGLVGIKILFPTI